MLTLAVETSCDDTCAAVLQNDRVLSSVISSQTDLHREWGGVVPDIAKRAHAARINAVIASALIRAKFKILNLKFKNNLKKLNSKEEKIKQIIEEGMRKIDVIAVTQGPGLAIALSIGVNTAKELAVKYNKPIVAVNHVEGHILSNLVKNRTGKPERKIELPALALTVSGGHTKIVLLTQNDQFEIRNLKFLNKKGQIQNLKSGKQDNLNSKFKIQNSKNGKQNDQFEIPTPGRRNWKNEKGLLNLKTKKDEIAAAIPSPAMTLSMENRLPYNASNYSFKYEVVGETLDDAAGEALDKAAKLLGLGYPGGPVIERLAKGADKNFIPLPKPLADKKILDYSFSGLKTSFYYQIKDWPQEKISQNLNKLAATFQEAVFETLLRKFRLAIEKFQPKTLLAAGGVLANGELRRQLRKLAREVDLPILMPVKKELNTDNAMMIGLAGYYKALRGEWADPHTLDRDPRLEF